MQCLKKLLFSTQPSELGPIDKWLLQKWNQKSHQTKRTTPNWRRKTATHKYCHTSKGSRTTWGNFWKNTPYKQYSSPPQKYNKCCGQQRTKGTPSPLQEYTGYLEVVDRYTVYWDHKTQHPQQNQHERHYRLKQLEKSAVAEHALKEAGHEILFQNTEVLDNTSNH